MKARMVWALQSKPNLEKKELIGELTPLICGHKLAEDIANRYNDGTIAVRIMLIS